MTKQIMPNVCCEDVLQSLQGKYDAYMKDPTVELLVKHNAKTVGKNAVKLTERRWCDLSDVKLEEDLQYFAAAVAYLELSDENVPF